MHKRLVLTSVVAKSVTATIGLEASPALALGTDGRFIAYTIAQLANHRAFAPDVIRYDVMTGRSVVLYDASKVVSPADNLEAQISGDGRHVAFQSFVAPAGTGGGVGADVYEWNAVAAH